MTSSNDDFRTKYRPRRYDGRIVFFKPQMQRWEFPRDPLPVWGDLVGEIEVITVPGDHMTMRDVDAETLAAAMGRCIQGALAKA